MSSLQSQIDKEIVSAICAIDATVGQHLLEKIQQITEVHNKQLDEENKKREAELKSKKEATAAARMQWIIQNEQGYGSDKSN